jgi:hypothetical protein
MVNNETIRSFLDLIDTCDRMTRDKLTLQEILDRHDINWKGEYESLKEDESFQRHLSVTLAEVSKNQKKMADFLRSQLSDSSPPPSDRIQ